MPLEFQFEKIEGEKVSHTKTIYIENKDTIDSLVTFIFLDKKGVLPQYPPEEISFDAINRVIPASTLSPFDITMSIDFASYTEPLEPYKFVMGINVYQEEYGTGEHSDRKFWIRKQYSEYPITYTVVAPEEKDYIDVWLDQEKTVPL